MYRDILNNFYSLECERVSQVDVDICLQVDLKVYTAIGDETIFTVFKGRCMGFVQRGNEEFVNQSKLSRYNALIVLPIEI